MDFLCCWSSVIACYYSSIVPRTVLPFFLCLPQQTWWYQYIMARHCNLISLAGSKHSNIQLVPFLQVKKFKVKFFNNLFLHSNFQIYKCIHTYMNFFIENSSCICFSPCDDNFTKNYIGIGQAAILGFKFFWTQKIRFLC